MNNKKKVKKTVFLTAIAILLFFISILVLYFMKRWIHSATDVPKGWGKDYNDDLGYYYYFKEDNGLKATMHWKDNDGDGYYAVSIFRPGQFGFVARKNIYPLEKAFDYADNILSDFDKANV